MSMKLILVGKKTINLRYMIVSEEHEGEPDDPPPGVVRVTLEAGRVFEFSGERADQFRRGLEAYFKPEAPRPGLLLPPGGSSTSAAPSPPPRKRRKPKGGG